MPHRSVGALLALAVLCACGSSGPPHPQGWTQSGTDSWTTLSGAGPERYTYASVPTQGSLTDLASAQAIATVQHYTGSKLIRSIPFGPCPGEAGLASYTLPHGRILEVAFSVNGGRAVTASYERPSSVAGSPDVVAAFRQAVCYVP